MTDDDAHLFLYAVSSYHGDVSRWQDRLTGWQGEYIAILRYHGDRIISHL